MNGFLQISRIMVPHECVQIAYDHMRLVGKKHLEGVALFVGREVDDTFLVTETIVPKQVALTLENGLLYSVGGEELHRLNVYLYTNNLSLISQIHSHPGLAYHSETDDAYPIVTTTGGLSIVVPNFAAAQASVDIWAVFQLSTSNSWVELGEKEKTSLISII
jgi:hypothetical protein